MSFAIGYDASVGGSGTLCLPPRYAGVRLLARGGMGEVYVARDRELERLVAIKALDASLDDEPEARARFKREALAAARLSGHPNVVTIFDIGESEGRPYIVMEYLTGGTVAGTSRRNPVARTHVLRWLHEAASALDAAHSAGVVHRDLKPSNLLLDSEGNVHVADFGIARVAGEATLGLTATGQVIGTAGYLSPEQAVGGEVTSASDLYALAVVAYELLAGSRPFARDSDSAEIAAHVHEPVPPASLRAPGLPPQVDEVFERALSKTPGERYPTAGRFVDALERALKSSDSPTRRLAAQAPRSVSFHRRRPRVLLGALGLVALLAMTATLAFLLSGESDGSKGAQGAAASIRERTVTLEGTTVVETVTTSAAPAVDPADEPATGADGHGLNDTGFAFMQDGRYAEALPLLEQAVRALRGIGPDDPYEAYANYNLGYTLIQLGRCKDALKPLRRSDRLQDRTELDEAIRAAEACR